MTKDCPICGNPFTCRRPSQQTCSAKCRNTHHSRKTAEQRGEKLRGNGEGKTYRKMNGRHEHRVIAEQILGRPLKPGEIVHHKDANKLNNDPSNLQVLASQSIHATMHAKKCQPGCTCGRHVNWRAKRKEVMPSVPA